MITVLKAGDARLCLDMKAVIMRIISIILVIEVDVAKPFMRTWLKGFVEVFGKTGERANQRYPDLRNLVKVIFGCAWKGLINFRQFINKR